MVRSSMMTGKSFTHLAKLFVYNRKFKMVGCNQITIDRVRGRLDLLCPKEAMMKDKAIEMIRAGEPHKDISLATGLTLQQLAWLVRTEKIARDPRLTNKNLDQNVGALNDTAPKGAVLKIYGEWHKLGDKGFVFVHHLGEWIRSNKSVNDYNKAIRAIDRRMAAEC